jgi:hypothetical protein
VRGDRAAGPVPRDRNHMVGTSRLLHPRSLSKILPDAATSPGPAVLEAKARPHPFVPAVAFGQSPLDALPDDVVRAAHSDASLDSE